MTDEEQRAAQWRADKRARNAEEMGRSRALSGNKARRKTLEDNWKPLLPLDSQGVPRQDNEQGAN